MALRSSDREAIEAEIDRVRSLGLEELRTLWRTMWRPSPPPALTKDLIARFKRPAAPSCVSRAAIQAAREVEMHEHTADRTAAMGDPLQPPGLLAVDWLR
jgi:hypothetical protein